MEEEHPTRFLWSYGRHKFVDMDPSPVLPFAKCNPHFLKTCCGKRRHKGYGNNYNVHVISFNHQRLVSLGGCMPSMYEYSRVSSSWEPGATSSRLTLVSLVMVMAFSFGGW